MSNGQVEKVTDIQFEHSPARGDKRYTGDGSAFDVFIEYRSPDNKSGFMGIEVKYHEGLTDAAAEHKARYDELALQMGCFHPSSRLSLRQKPLQQIWRDHLLAGSLLEKQDYEEGLFVFLYPEKNTACARAIQSYAKCLSHSNTFQSWTLERLVTEIKAHTTEEWINLFYDRYLNFSKVPRQSIKI